MYSIYEYWIPEVKGMRIRHVDEFCFGYMENCKGYHRKEVKNVQYLALYIILYRINYPSDKKGLEEMKDESGVVRYSTVHLRTQLGFIDFTTVVRY